jgi:methyl coenzyme M reductase beta subunit
VGVWLAVNAAIGLIAALCLDQGKTRARQGVELQ